MNSISDIGYSDNDRQAKVTAEPGIAGESFMAPWSSNTGPSQDELLGLSVIGTICTLDFNFSID